MINVEHGSCEKEIFVDGYISGAGSIAVLPGGSQQRIKGWTFAVVYSGIAGTFSVYSIFRGDDEDRSHADHWSLSLSGFSPSAGAVRKRLLCHGSGLFVRVSSGRENGSGSSAAECGNPGGGTVYIVFLQ